MTTTTEEKSRIRKKIGTELGLRRPFIQSYLFPHSIKSMEKIFQIVFHHRSLSLSVDRFRGGNQYLFGPKLTFILGAWYLSFKS